VIPLPDLLLQGLVAGLLIGVFYGLLLHRIGRLSGTLAKHLMLSSRLGWARVTDICKLSIATLSQLVFALILIAVTGVKLGAVFGFDPLLVALGVLLGVAQMGLVSLCANVAMHTASALLPDAAPQTNAQWLAIARGGWMREYHSTINAAPRTVAVLIVSAYVLVEELVFRATLITYFADHGPLLAIGLSSAAFILVQVLHTPNWKTAMFPVIGALIVGPVHGYLFYYGGDITPLVVAHATFFLVAVL